MSDEPLRCDACRYYDYAGMPDVGLCRRSPPQFHDIGSGCWPAVEADDWCGEWAPKPGGFGREDD